VAFWEEVYPLLERKCLSCHGPKRQEGGFRVDRREDFFGKDGGERQVIPGDSAGSPLIALVTGHRPAIARADVHRLSDREVSLLWAWIDVGAPWPEKSARDR
jgi:hypothetical protein